MNRKSRIIVEFSNGNRVTALLDMKLDGLMRPEIDAVVDELTEGVADVIRSPRYHEKVTINNVRFV